MLSSEQLIAIESIKQAKSRYLRGVDTSDGEMVKQMLASDCVLDYTDCCTDPASGRDYFPQMSIVLRGRDAWTASGFSSMGVVSVHQSYNFDIAFQGPTAATSVCSMSDRLYMPPGHAFSLLTGYGHYHETYEKRDDAWLLKTLRIARLRVEVV